MDVHMALSLTNSDRILYKTTNKTVNIGRVKFPWRATILNIARGTTDPGYWLYNLNHFSDRNQFEGGVTCIGSKFGQDVA